MLLRLYKRGKIFWYRGTVAGRELYRSTGTTEKARAQRIAAEAEAAAWARHLDGPGAGVTFAQAAIAYRQAGRSARFLEAIEDHFKDTHLRDITPGAVRALAIKLYPAASGATRNRQVIVPAAAVINHAAELEWCAPIKVKRFKVISKPKRPVDLAWIETFAAHASPHLGALAMFMFGTGARIGEAVALRWADVDLGAREALIRQTKTGGNMRLAHLPPPVVAALANIPSNRQADEPVFGYAGRDSVTQPWAKVEARAGLDHRSPHCCRHGFATEMLRAGADVKTVAAAGGWKDAALLVRTYAHAREDKTITDALFRANSVQPFVEGRVRDDEERRNHV